MAQNNLGNKEILSANLRRFLDNEDLNPKDFSRKMNFKYSTVLDWVNGRSYPRIDKIELMARFFKVDKSDLIEEYRPNDESEEILDLTDIASKTAAYDGHTLDDSDIELIKSLLENMVKNK